MYMYVVAMFVRHTNERHTKLYIHMYMYMCTYTLSLHLYVLHSEVNHYLALITSRGEHMHTHNVHVYMYIRMCDVQRYIHTFTQFYLGLNAASKE